MQGSGWTRQAGRRQIPKRGRRRNPVRSQGDGAQSRGNPGPGDKDLRWDRELLSSSALAVVTRLHLGEPGRHGWREAVLCSSPLDSQRLQDDCSQMPHSQGWCQLTMLVSQEMPPCARRMAVFRSGPFLFGFREPRDLEGLPHVPLLWSPCCSAL